MENALETEQTKTIKKITGILEIYADQSKVDWAKVSAEIYEIVLSDVVTKLVLATFTKRSRKMKVEKP